MKQIVSVAKAEVSSLLYSPIAWLVMIVMVLQTGIWYVGNIYTTYINLSGGIEQPYLTANIFGLGFSSIWKQLQDNLHLILPLLTMGVFSREYSSGSINLLFSSPVNVYKIVIGKYIGIVLFLVMLLILSGTLVLAGWFSIEGFDAPAAFSGMLGLFLIMSCYAAIGIFVSSLTRYQIVAAASTFIALGLLYYIPNLWRGNELIRDITYYTTIKGRANGMIAGLISSSDVIYFLTISLLFLAFTFFRLIGARQKIPGYLKVLRNAGCFLAAVTIIYFSSRPQAIAYWDVTRDGNNTLSVGSQKVLARIKSPVRITTYVNLLAEQNQPFLPKFRNQDIQTLQGYYRFLPNLEIKYVDYYATGPGNTYKKENPGLNDTELAAKVADMHLENKEKFRPATAIPNVKQLADENFQVVRVFDYKGKNVLQRATYDDMEAYAYEPENSTAFKKLVARSPEVFFSKGHNERDINRQGDADYDMITQRKRFRYSLINQGFSVRAINLLTDSLDVSAAALVIADPKLPFSQTEMNRITSFIEKGGNLLVAAEQQKTELLEPICKSLGVQFLHAAVLQKGDDAPPQVIQGVLTPKALDLCPGLKEVFKRKDKVYLNGVVALDHANEKNFIADTLVAIDTTTTWIRPGQHDVTDSVVAHFSPSLSDQKLHAPLVLALHRKVNDKEQRIVIAGDADMFSNNGVWRQANFAFSTQLFSWLSNGEFPVDTSRPDPKDDNLKIGLQGISALRWIFFGIIPGLLALIAGIILIKRQRR